MTIFLRTCLVSVWLSTTLAHAQQTSDNEPAVLGKLVAIDERDSAAYVPEVTSTATGLNLSLRDTPQSVTVITPEQIKDQGMSTVADALRSATGVSRTAVDQVRTEVSVRGFNVDSYQYDGVPVPTGNNVNHDLANTAIYERIEIVRGATGLLNGPGDPSAAINLVRKHANARTLTGTINATAGRWSYQTFTADVAAPLNQNGTVRARAVVNGGKEHSFIERQGARHQVFYGVLDADLGSSTQLSLGASHQEENRDDTLWFPLPVWYADGSRTDWQRSKNTSSDWATWRTSEDSAFVTLTHRLNNQWTWRTDITRHKNVDDEKLLWWSGDPGRTTGLGMTTMGYRWTNTSVLRQASTALSGSFSWLGRTHQLNAGMVYSHFSSRWHDVQNDPNPNTQQPDFNNWDGRAYPEPVWGAAYLGSEDITRQLAAYGVARFNVTDTWNLITGARLNYWYWHTRQAGWTPVAFEVNKRGIVTPYAGVVHDLNNAVSVYASYTTIFKPQTNYRDRYGKYLDPLQGKSYELGLKGEWLDGYLHASAAVFRTEQDNFAIADGNAKVPNTANIQAYYAGRGVKAQGYEFDVVGDLTEQWNLSASWTHYSAKDGQNMDVAVDHPRRLFKLYTKYAFVGPLMGWRTGAGINWQSRQLRQTANPATGQLEAIGQQAYALVDAMLGYAITSRVDMQLNLSNVLDKKYKASSFWNAFTYGEPRNWRASLSYQFE